VNERLASTIEATGRSPQQLVSAVNRRLVAGGQPALDRSIAYKWIEGSTPRGIVPVIVAEVLSEWSGFRITPADLSWNTRWAEPLDSDTQGWGARTALRVLPAEMGDGVER